MSHTHNNLLWSSTSSYTFVSDDNNATSSWSSIVGIITAIVGNILISFALNIQRYAHIRIDREYHTGKDDRKAQNKLPKSIRGYGTAVRQEEVAEERARLNATAPGPGNEEENDADETRPLNESFHSDNTDGTNEKEDDGDDGRKSYLTSPYWWAGIILMTIGEAGNFLAYGFAPASIVSPLGVVALISNCLIAPLMLKEQFRKRDFWGVLVAIGGAVTVVLSAKTSETKMGPKDLWDAIRRWEFLTYIGITFVFIIILMVASPRYGRRTILIDLGLVGLFGGYTALSTKGVASMLSDTLWRAFGFPITYALIAVLIISAVLQIRYINRALSHFDSTQVIPTQFVLFTLSVIIGSAVLYRDFEKTDPDHVIKFVMGCLLTFSGVWLITSGRKNDDDDEDDDEPTHDETIQLIDEEAVTESGHVPDKQQTILEVDEPNDNHDDTHLNVDELQQKISSSIPSLAVTPYDASETSNQNSWTFSNEDADGLSRPKTPARPSRLQSEPNLSPFFTPISTTRTTPRPPPRISRADSSPANPQTPTRQSRATSPPKPDPAVVQQNQLLETPHSQILRSARGSFQRFMPGPLVPPLSGSLSALVADSLLRGEGSPQGKLSRQSIRRMKSSGRRRSGAGLTPEDPNYLDSPVMSRWQTREEVPETPMSTMSDIDPMSRTESSRKPRSRLGSISDTLGGFLRPSRDRGKDVERDGADDNGPHVQAKVRPRSNTDS